MAIYLLRHGETPGNAARVIQKAEVPLSERGEEQARRAALRLAAAGVTHILASDLTRATRTAEHLREATGAPLELEPLLQERNLGDLRGTPYAEIEFDVFAPGYEPPGGESWEIFHERVTRAWRRVLEVAARSLPTRRHSKPWQRPRRRNRARCASLHLLPPPRWNPPLQRHRISHSIANGSSPCTFAPSESYQPHPPASRR